MLKWVNSLIWTLQGLCDNCGGKVEDIAERRAVCSACGKCFR